LLLDGIGDDLFLFLFYKKYYIWCLDAKASFLRSVNIFNKNDKM